MLHVEENGEVNLAANCIAITPERTKLVEFSDGCLSVQQRLLARSYVGVKSARFKFASSALTYERLGFVFAQGSNLIQTVNQALRELHQNGTLNELAQRCFSDKFTVTYHDIER
jgi:ABC-type amino acid transport substrate-binding protein